MQHILWATTALTALFLGATAEPPTPVEFAMVPNACASDMPGGLGPSITPDTAAAFLSYAPFAANATASQTVTGYLIVAANQKAWAESTTVPALGWLNLATYDVTYCGTYCSNTAGCAAFDIFYQRSPSVAPSFNSSCPNPPSMTSIMCWIYNGTLAASDLINSGETRGQFQVVIAGKSNSYVPSSQLVKTS